MGKYMEFTFILFPLSFIFSVRHDLRRAQDTTNFKGRQIQTHKFSLEKNVLAFLKLSVHYVTKKEKLRKAIKYVELFSDEEYLIVVSCKDNSDSN
jgi:hypothetical protein